MLQNAFFDRLDRFYNWIIRIGSNLQSFFLLYMRLTWGHQLFLAGLKKLGTIPATAAYFDSIQIPFPLFHAYLVANLETIAGFCLFVGFASRLVAIPVICIMLTALSTAHASDLSNLRFLFEPIQVVQQAPYPYLITALLVFVFGPGRVSVDAWLKRWVEKQPRY